MSITLHFSGSISEDHENLVRSCFHDDVFLEDSEIDFLVGQHGFVVDFVSVDGDIENIYLRENNKG